MEDFVPIIARFEWFCVRKALHFSSKFKETHEVCLYNFVAPMGSSRLKKVAQPSIRKIIPG